MRLRVSSIDASLTKVKLQEIFEEYGRISSVKLFRSVDGTTPALGFIEMTRERDAQAAIADLNGKRIGNSRLKVELSSDVFHSSAPIVVVNGPADDDDDDDDDPDLDTRKRLPADLEDELEEELGDDEEEMSYDNDDDEFDDDEPEEVPLDELDEEI